MTCKTRLLISVVFGALVAAPAMAQGADPVIDVNADGMYSFPELQAALPDTTEESFVALDANGDGLLDADEIAVGVEAGLLPAIDG